MSQVPLSCRPEMPVKHSHDGLPGGDSDRPVGRMPTFHIFNETEQEFVMIEDVATPRRVCRIPSSAIDQPCAAAYGSFWPCRNGGVHVRAVLMDGPSHPGLHFCGPWFLLMVSIRKSSHCVQLRP